MNMLLKPENVALLVKIQSQLKAPKGQFNSFGKYNYRSAEDILDAAKPIAHALGCAVGCTDEVLFVEGRYYVVAMSFVIFPDGEVYSVQGWAREEESKKGMDASQVTGSCSSYARKYSLNGLLAIDDSRNDPDATNDHGKAEVAPQPQAKPQPKAKVTTALAIKQKQFGDLCRTYKKSQTEEQQPLEALLFDKISANGFKDIAGLKACTNETVFDELIDILDLAIASAQ